MEQHNNILGTMPVRKLVLTMSSPIMLSMLMGAIYNLVDSIYVAQVSELESAVAEKEATISQQAQELESKEATIQSQQETIQALEAAYEEGVESNG